MMMKLISLNIWGGAVFEPLLTFVKEHAPSTDIFCFQEIYTSPENVVSNGTHVNIFETLSAALPDFNRVFAPIQDNMDEEGSTNITCTFGQAIFVRKVHEIVKNGFTFAYRERNSLVGKDITTLAAGFQQIAIIRGDDESATHLTVIGIHGTSLPGDKLDTPARIAQSEKIKELLASVTGPKILCGDFNLAPETQSIAILDGIMKNLIKEFGIKKTRSAINDQKYIGKVVQQFADYTFVSPEVTVHSFEVPDVAVSDHLPMILEFSY